MRAEFWKLVLLTSPNERCFYCLLLCFLSRNFLDVQKYKTITLNDGIKVYVPLDSDGCYVTKTPCVSGANHISAKKQFGFLVFNNKN